MTTVTAETEDGNNIDMIDEIFHDVDSSISPRVVDFIASVKAAQKQLVSSGGINLQLYILYTGEDDISIHNPLYFLQISVLNEKGTPLQLKMKPPIPLIHTKAPLNPDEDFVFTITGISHDTNETNISDEVNKPVVLFRKGLRYIYDLIIEQYLNPNTNDLEQIPKGEYNLELMLSLVAADSTDTLDDAEGRTLRLSDLRISLNE